MVQWRHNRPGECNTSWGVGDITLGWTACAGSNFPAIVGLRHAFLPPCPILLSIFCSRTGLDIGLASRPGCGKVGLHSVEPFHYKLLAWRTQTALTRWLAAVPRSVLMCRLIMPPLLAGVRLSLCFPGFPHCSNSKELQWGNEYWIDVA